MILWLVKRAPVSRAPELAHSTPMLLHWTQRCKTFFTDFLGICKSDLTQFCFSPSQ